MGEEFNEELVATAMQIIMNAGDARLSVKDALSHAKAFDFTEAEKRWRRPKSLSCRPISHRQKLYKAKLMGKI